MTQLDVETVFFYVCPECGQRVESWVDNTSDLSPMGRIHVHGDTMYGAEESKPCAGMPEEGLWTRAR